MRNKCIIALISFFLGTVVCYHIIIHHGIDYRITFYGYVENNGVISPVIKLRKKMKGAKTFNIQDEGVELTGVMVGDMGTGIEFTDKDAENMFRKKYCQ